VPFDPQKPFLPKNNKQESSMKLSIVLCRSIIRCGFLAAIYASVTYSQAEPAPQPNDKDKAEAIEEVVISATRSEIERWKTAVSLTSIPRTQIERQQIYSLSDALRTVPGLTLADQGYPGSLAGVFIRGTKTQNSALLIDGRPIPGNLAGGFNVENVQLDNIERVEVLRGPAASLYGGRTLGGVMNLISRSGKDLEKPEVTAFFEAGSYGTFREGVSTLGAVGAFDWALQANRTDIQGQRTNSQLQNTSFANRLGFDVTPTLRLEFDTRYTTAEIGIPGSISSPDSDSHLTYEFWSLSPRLIWQTTDNWKQQLTYSRNQFRQVATNFDFSGGNNRVSSQSDFLEYLSTVDVTDQWQLTAGAWIQEIGYTRYNDDAVSLFNPGGKSFDVDNSETNWALFLQNQLEVAHGLHLSGSVRYDSYSDYESAVTWRAALAYQIPVIKTILHANYGTAFSPPAPQDVESALFGETSLIKPERSRGYEFGITQPWLDNQMSLSLTYFQNDIQNFIEFDPKVPPFGELQQIDRARTQGLESNFQWTPNKQFGMNLSYTYLDAENRTDDLRLVRRPRHQLNTDLWVKPITQLQLGLSTTYLIDREDGFGSSQSDQEDSCNVRLTASWRVSDHIEVYGRVENLLGDDYQDARGFPAMDTGAYGGIKIRF
jgi:vitamin B12 transporter